MKKYFVMDKANLQKSIFILVKDEMDNSYRFIDIKDATIIPISFREVANALAWLDIGYEWDLLNF